MLRHSLECVIKSHLPTFLGTVIEPIKRLLKYISPLEDLSLFLPSPRILRTYYVSTGNRQHCHVFQLNKDWDHKRFGPEVTDMELGDKHDGHYDMPLATYRWLYGCKCSAEIIQEVRALL